MIEKTVAKIDAQHKELINMINDVLAMSTKVVSSENWINDHSKNVDVAFEKYYNNKKS